MGSPRRSPAEQALELFVYAPIGLALELRESLPRFVSRGRGQVALAQLIAKFAADRGRREVDRLVSPAPAVHPGARATTDSTAAEVDDLVAGYDELPAVEIVRALESLDALARARIRAHERAGRHRVTVLNKLDRLDRAAD